MIYSVLITVCCFFTSVDNLNPPEVQVLIQTGLKFAYAEKFDSAQIYFDEVIKLFPENPAGYFFKAALLQLKMMDQCQYLEEKEYLLLMDRITQCAEKLLEEKENLWAQFYLGSSYTYRAVYAGFKGDYFETFKYGVKGGKLLQNIIKKDTTFYDAYLGAGSFEYFWARAARYLPVLKLAGGDANEAIRKLHAASEKSLYSGPTAKNSLVFIYGEEGDFNKADSIIDGLLSKYPDSRTFLWNKAELEFNKKNYLVAADLYNNLFSIYNSQNNKNYANLAQCKLFIGKCFYKLKEEKKAKQALKKVISFKKYSDEYPQIKIHCRVAYGLLSRIF
jgi:tetratricopeptide (TPR) repeat protein